MNNDEAQDTIDHMGDIGAPDDAQAAEIAEAQEVLDDADTEHTSSDVYGSSSAPNGLSKSE